MELDLAPEVTPAPLDTPLPHELAGPTQLRGLPLLDLVIHQIELSPDTWNQENWRCQTGMCVAGWAATLAGGEWISKDPNDSYSEYLHAADDDHPDTVTERCVLESGGRPRGYCDDPKPGEVWTRVKSVTAQDRATALLGLDIAVASDLFAGSNDLPTIKAIRDGIADGTYRTRLARRFWADDED